MTTIPISPTGRLTIPVAMRRRLGWAPGTRLDVSIRGDQIVLRRIRSIRELEGIFAHYAIPGMTHEREHDIFERAVAEHVMAATEGHD